mgnify:CR=1 FL=1
MKRVVRIIGRFMLMAAVGLPLRAAEKQIRVVTTFLPGYCIAAHVAGSHARVENLLPGNVSLHDYQLSPGDLARFSRADVILINGLGMETFLDRAIRNSGPETKTRIVTLTAGFHSELIHQHAQHRAEPGHDHAHDHAHDPHVWLDPRLMARCVTNAVRAFQKADPANADAYAKNGATYIQKLHALDADLEKQLAPVKNLPFVTYHDAFRYFIRRYGLVLAGVVEQVPEIPPSARELSSLLKTIREKKVKALFTEPGERSRLAERIAEDAGIKLGVLDPLETGELYPESYERGMRKNAAALLEGLR